MVLLCSEPGGVARKAVSVLTLANLPIAFILATCLG